ncbi:MAG: AtpZ/AtpI family protein [Myxococcota bacterium]
MAEDERRRMWKLAGRYSSVGIEMAASLALGAIGGGWLDQKFGTGPWLQTAGIVLGVIMAVQSVVRVVRRYQADQGGNEKRGDG